MECLTFMHLETETCMLKDMCLKKEKYSGFAALLSSRLTSFLMTVKQPKQT